MEVTGTVKKVGAKYTVGAKKFPKRDLVLTTDEKYPQTLSIEFSGDKTDLLNNVKEGEQVLVGINLRGREWINDKGESKYFNSINGWRIGSPKEGNEPIQAEEEQADLPF